MSDEHSRLKRALSRRNVLGRGVAGGMAVSFPPLALAAARPATPKGLPNILWMVSEDNNPYLGAYGDPIAHTPHLDALAKKGVLYRNAFSNAPVCATSRFGILTGVHAESCSPAQHMRANAHLPKQLKTYPEYLREAGYYCLNNFKTDYNCDIDPKIIWDDNSRTAQWRNRPAGKPFMAVFNDLTTHESQIFFKTEGRVKPEDVRVPAYLPDTPEVRTDLSSYYNRIEMMDANCGKRLAALEADGLAEDTIVFYYSDNGGVMPRSKHYSYDEGYRTCLMIYVPPKWQHLAPAPAGSVVNSPVSYIDLVPTLLSLIGQPKAPHMVGRALLGPYAGSPEKFAFGANDRQGERYDFNRTVCDGRYRYIRNYLPDVAWGTPMSYSWVAKSYQSWERAHDADRLNPAQDRFFQTKPYEEFYDLGTDRDQVRNLIGDPAQAGRIAAMRSALDRHMVKINDNGFIPEGHGAEGYFQSRNRTAYPLGKLMALAQQSARRDPRNLERFRKQLSHDNDLVRYWAVYGIKLLGSDAGLAEDRLVRLAEHDPSPYVRLQAASALCETAQHAKGIANLATILDAAPSVALQLQAISALILAGRLALPALPSIRRLTASDDENLHAAARYLTAVLEGVYAPGYDLLDRSWYDRKNGPYLGQPMPGPTF
ncbi:sulfatase-like hydrolase/transferase [Sphingobium boeckii]|uniref:Arylsulfatase A-like enzyme n=1 Tax=Sphingobium boeckii TaxID=1082345 RepID=A0A7W9AJ05_9SPHN|nr:sulfatase-like hydrolase/transferase [Sphingobium boeckii]MBB5686352.1 arylsulfatase A-like enzyme [Sphingobium boeckii]